MARTMTLAATSLSCSGDAGLASWDIPLKALESVSLTDVFRLDTKLTSTSDVHTLTNLLGGNLTKPSFTFFQNHAATTLTLKVIHSGGTGTSDEYVVQALGFIMLFGVIETAATETSWTVTGTAGDAYTLVLGDTA